MEIIAHLQHMSKMLGNLDHWLGKAAEYAAARPFDPNVLLQARLAPDMFPLVRQVQSACDAAKFAAAYLAGQTAPAHPDTETTLAEIRERIAVVRAYLDGFGPADFAGGGERLVTSRALRGKTARGSDYLLHLAVPNFFFHVSMAYALLRHNGVPLGKQDYLGGVPVLES